MRIKTLMIIPARSGSKGIVNKNIRNLGKYPLFGWSALAAKQAGIDDALLILSTDSEAYKKIGEQLGIQVPFIRPEQYSADNTSAFHTAQHAINWFKKQYDYQPEQIMWLQPTSPFRSPKSIQQAIELMNKQSLDAVIGCKAIERDLTTLFKLKEDYLTPLSQATTQIRRQAISPLLTPNGAMYLVKTKVFLEKESFFPPKSHALLMDDIMSHDIDNETDWLIAQAYLNENLGWMENLNNE